MVDNVGRKIVLIALLLGASLLLLILPNPKLRMGLDLAGGLRMVYRIPFEKALEEGLYTQGESRVQIRNDTIQIIRERIDPQGVTEPIIRPLGGEDLFEIAIPGEATFRSASARGTLGEAVPATGNAAIVLHTDFPDPPEDPKDRSLPRQFEDLEDFPGGGGGVRIGPEKIKYTRRAGNRLEGITRGYEDHPIEAHAAGADVVLVSDDQIKAAIENLGDMRWMIVAEPNDFPVDPDETKARQNLLDWWEENPAAPIAAYNALPTDQGGPPPGIVWFPHRLPEGAEAIHPKDGQIHPLIVQENEGWHFSGEDLQVVKRGQDEVGYPAVQFLMSRTNNARARFGNFTGDYVERQLAIVLNDWVISAPVLNGALRGTSIIKGRFTSQEVDRMVRVLRSGSLRIKPELQHRERVGATLGHTHVRKGFLSGLIGLAAVLGFMIVYYKGLGIYAAASLVASLVMLMGAMTFLQATLTLPGIAGIILTIGMAVDANILIFDRIREEAEKGHKALQSAQNGFKHALSAIIDANVTTLLTALILMNVGTGPVRGFAVTLAIGILTSVFSALVITRVLVHFQLERGAKAFPMKRWLADAKFAIVQKAGVCMAGSLGAIVLGVGLFLWLPDTQKLGIDFLGGATVKVRTEEAQTESLMRDRGAGIRSGAAGGVDVQSLPASGVGGGRYTEFRLTAKSTGDSGGETAFEGEVRAGLQDILQKGPVEIAISTAGDQQTTDMTLYFVSDHPVDDVSEVLVLAGLKDPQLSPRAERPEVLDVAAGTTFGLSEVDLRNQVMQAFDGAQDSLGASMSLADPIPEVTVVGGQVVGDLRDAAIRALILSLFAVVMYIRIRFAEYSYGLAALAAVLHDVLIVLGLIALGMWLGVIQVEINLPLIAAFLTIIGYSLNDTIVVFDRVRENLPRMKGSLREIVNASINQTLSRTVITSGTTLVTILVLFALNYGQGSILEGFTFAMAAGVIVGTYSSLFIASPVFIWLEERAQRKRAARA